MARIRTIKPEFPQSETIGRLSRDARLLFIQLWTLVDDEGRTRAASRMLASLLYPYDNDAPGLMEGWLTELEAQTCIRRYTIDGNAYLDIPHWKQHQKVDHPAASRLPAFPESVAPPREVSRSLAPDLGPSTKDLGPGPRTVDQDSRLPPRAVPRAGMPDIPDFLDRRIEADPRKAIFGDALRWLIAKTGRGEPGLRAMLGRWAKARGDPELAAALIAAQQQDAHDPIAWIEARLKSNGQRKPSDLDHRRALADAFDEVAAEAEARAGRVGT